MNLRVEAWLYVRFGVFKEQEHLNPSEVSKNFSEESYRCYPKHGSPEIMKFRDDKFAYVVELESLPEQGHKSQSRWKKWLQTWARTSNVAVVWIQVNSENHLRELQSNC